jgi:hypothetical protein
LIAEFEMAQYQRSAALSNISLFEKQSAQTKQIVDLLVAEYSTAEADFQEILRTQQQLLEFETKTTTSQKDFHQAQAKLIYLTAIELNN